MRYIPKKKRKVQLTERDKEIIEQVFQHRFMLVEHIRSWVEPEWDIATCRRRITALWEANYLDRLSHPDDSGFKKEGGSYPFVYALGNKGAKYLREAKERPGLLSDQTSKNKDYTDQHVRHTLLTTHFMVGIHAGCRKYGLKLIDQSDVIMKFTTEFHRQEMREKGVFRSRGWFIPGENKSKHIPDRMFIIHNPRREKPNSLFFLESDTGKESLTIIGKKCLAYRATNETVMLNNFKGIPRATTVFTCPKKPRMTNMRNKCIDVTAGGVGNILFTNESEYGEDFFTTPFYLSNRDKSINLKEGLAS